MKPRIQRKLVGKKYGMLRVTQSLGQKNGNGHFLSLAVCDCGNEVIVRDTWLVNGNRDRCPICSKKKTMKHGLTGTRLFNTWQAMQGRCGNPNNKEYQYYGGRGIKVCDEWKDSFIAFRNWALSNGYQSDLWIERIDVNGNYEPANCTWKTQLEQARNKTNTIYVNYEGKRLSICEVAEITGISRSNIYQRLFKYHWNEYDATHIPVGCKR